MIMYKFFATAICIALLAQPIGAAAAPPNSSAEDQVPVVFDAFLMRPLGFGAMVGGFAVFTLGVVMPPFVLAWRPSEMHKPFNSLVTSPFRFTFVDPLGYHPNRVKSNRAGEIE
jgi:hypothetical protein